MATSRSKPTGKAPEDIDAGASPFQEENALVQSFDLMSESPNAINGGGAPTYQEGMGIAPESNSLLGGLVVDNADIVDGGAAPAHLNAPM